MDYKEYIEKTSKPVQTEDDGSLSFLGLNTDEERKSFSCASKTQTELVDKTFWVLKYFANVKGRDDSVKYIYKAKFNLEDDESLAFKVWTGSKECWNILDRLGEMKKFPRKVTLRRRSKGGMYFE